MAWICSNRWDIASRKSSRSLGNASQSPVSVRNRGFYLDFSFPTMLEEVLAEMSYG